uniref:Rab-GAP TBC domain-containing protein n=1 Tax=Physcomitrium patens TaxID=3218 RepID=A0A7I4EI56_PHYPA
MMSTGNGSSMNPKPVPAWLNSAAWTSKPRSPIKPSYSFGERSNSATLMEPVGKSTGDQEDLLSSIAKVEKEVAATQEESDATGSATQPTQNADYSEPSSYTDENKVVKSPSSFDYRVSLFNTELSRRRIHLAELQRLTSQGIPDSGGIRAITWKVLLGYLSRNRDDWATELEKKRAAYAVFREEMIINPSEVTRRKEEMEAMKAAELEALEGPLQRHEISHDDHPLSLGSKSVWHQFFQDTELAEQINRDVKRTHPDMQFFCGDNDFARENQKHAEEDSFFCFVELLSDFRDHFCQQLDNSAVGIRSTISQMTQLLRKHDEELWRHLEITSKVNPQFYAFRWITLLLTQEFNFADSLRLWDSLLSNPDGPLEILLRVCCSMLLCLRSRLLAGDFTTNLKLLQHYPSVDINHLLKVADDLKELK